MVIHTQQEVGGYLLAKKLIQEFRKSLAELLETGKKEEVYRLNIQLYPLKK